MITRSNLHSHSLFSDGADSMEDMVHSAIRKGFVSLGFSEHAWAEYDPDYCIKRGDIPAYFEEFNRLKKQYDGQIELYIGIESDYYNPAPKESLDFVIGSVHYLRDETGKYHTIDYKTVLFESALQEVAGGDIRVLVNRYYAAVSDFAETYRPDIIGHLDLIAKLNENSRYFNEQSDWYRQAVSAAVERIVAAGCIVEVNTGAIFRGYRDVPYPTAEILALLRELEAPVIVSSDAHTAESLDYWFEEAEELLRETGYRFVKQLAGGRFVDVEL